MAYLYSPCRPCPCGCQAAPGFICVCNCKTAYPITAHMGDDAGTHQIGGFTGRWSGNYQIDLQTYYWQYAYACGSEPFSVGVCKPDTIKPATVNIFLDADCAAGVWRLQKTWQVTVCFDDVLCKYVNRPSGGNFSNPYQGVVSEIPIDCEETSLLTFNFPTMHEQGYPVPGGGGEITVVFG